MMSWFMRARAWFAMADRLREVLMAGRRRATAGQEPRARPAKARCAHQRKHVLATCDAEDHRGGGA